ncbi:MAG: phosphoenolpyruvate--protein phosphotransferase [Devosia sp.]|nr:phosphoenolpyruvate--protein phosphotransferase [Devosia sp.]
MFTPLSAKGIVASVGYASGPLFLIDAATGTYVANGAPDTEAARLHAAIAQARAEVATLMSSADDDSALILEFQMAMMEDESLAAPAFAAIGGGNDAANAWIAALNKEIDGYDTAEDSYFRARGADLRDIHDRVLRALTGAAALRAPAGAVLFGRDLSPTQFLATDWAKGGGIVLLRGSTTSHVAMLARARGIPMLVGVGDLQAANDHFVLVDAEHGKVTVLPDAAERHEFLKASTAHLQLMNLARTQMGEPAVTADGAAIEVLVNVAEPTDVDRIDPEICAGVGLMRTEFLFNHGLPDEETQYAAYRHVLAWAGNRPVTIRTVDAGGDKPVRGFTVEETNPFLGLRGIRLSLSRPEVFRVQIRALLRAAVIGNLKVMFPMISLASEYAAAKALFDEETAALAAAGVPHKMPPLGIMVEVPAVAIAPEAFADVAFFSIGSNDLTQYVMAAGRDNGAVAALSDVRHPAILALIEKVTRYGAANDISVSLCGDAGGDPQAIPFLLRAGLRQLSVAPAQLPLAKAAIARASLHG